MNKEIYEAELKEKEETRTVKIQEGEELLVEYLHEPNIVGLRSVYTGLPIWVGRTTAKASKDDGTVIEDVANCWLKEPYTYSRGRVVSTGRLLKQLRLPTLLAEQVKDEIG